MRVCFLSAARPPGSLCGHSLREFSAPHRCAFPARYNRRRSWFPSDHTNRGNSMKLPNRGRRAVALLYGLLLLTVPGIYGQTPGTADKNPPAPSTAAEKSNEPAPRRWSIGLRVRTLPVRSLSVMDNGTTMNTTTVSNTNFDWNYTTTSKSFVLGGGVTFEVPISRRTLFTAELIFNRLSYGKVTNEYWGTDDPTTANDERSPMT